MCTVSVIIPNYNHAAYLAQRITSVLNQSLPPSEIIILDDFSTDNSRAVINEFANQDARILTTFNDRNSGSPFKQWAKGLSMAREKYIWIAESDDYADPAFLEKAVSMLDKEPTAGMVYSQSWLVDDKGVIIDSCRNLYKTLAPDIVHSGKEILEQHMAGTNIIPNASAVVFRKQVADQIENAYQDFRLSGDWWFWCQLLSVSDLFYIDEELNYFRSHTQKVTVASHKDQTAILESLRVLQLLYQKRLISSKVFHLKSKNVARQLADRQKDRIRALRAKNLFPVLAYAWRNNTVFLWQYVRVFLRGLR